MSDDNSKPRSSGKGILFLLALMLIAASAINYLAIVQQAALTRESNKTNREVMVSSQRA